MGEVVYAAPEFAARARRAGRVATTARILVVDADPATLAAIAQALQSEGHSTATAFDATAAIAVAERLGPFQLLVADATSPAADIVALVGALRRGEPELQVLYLTDGRDGIVRPSPLTSDDTVLEKPFSETALVDAVSSLLYSHDPDTM